MSAALAPTPSSLTEQCARVYWCRARTYMDFKFVMSLVHQYTAQQGDSRPRRSIAVSQIFATSPLSQITLFSKLELGVILWPDCGESDYHQGSLKEYMNLFLIFHTFVCIIEDTIWCFFRMYFPRE